MVKAMVPSPTASKRRRVFGPWQKVCQASVNVWSTGVPGLRKALRGSCFHMATTLSTKVITATVCTTRMRRPGE